ncbi:putative ribonuclease H-like domain-containing protein [Tanacetum coccineum]
MLIPWTSVRGSKSTPQGFLKTLDSLNLDGENRVRTHLRLFQFPLHDQASNWLERLPSGSITTWEDLTTRFLAQFFPSGRTAKLRNNILMFQQHHGESLSESWTRFKDLLQKVPHHGIDLWLYVQIFYDHVNPVTRQTIDQSADGKLRDKKAEESWALLEDLALYDNENKLRNRSRIGINKWYQSFALRNFDLEVIEFESAHSNTTAKLPILKLENGNSWVSAPQTTQENGTSVTKMSVPVTAEEKTNKKNDVKARSLLLMALLNEHQLTFSQYNDAKTMFAAIETGFGGNEATKKTQKTLLKQQYENFSASSSESLDSIFSRLQKIVSKLAYLGIVISQEDLNSNFLSSLPPEWNTHVVVWMNKAEIEIMSIDDLYNNFKIVEQKVKKYVGASSGAQNLAFMTAPSTSNTNDVNTAKHAYEVSTVSPNDLEQIHEDDLEAIDLKWQLSLLSMRAKRYYQRTCKKIFINANDNARYDKSKVEYFNYHKIGHFDKECRAPRNKEGQFRNQDNTRKHGNNEDTSSKAMLAIDGVGFDWSDMAEEQVQTNMALMAFPESVVYNDKTCSKTCLKNYETLKKQCDDLIVKLNKTEFTAATYKRGLATVEEQLITYRKNEVLFNEVAVLKREVACKDYEINVLKSEFEKVKQEKEGITFKIEKFDKASKDLDKLLGSQITDKSKKGLGYNVVPPPHPLIYNRPKKLNLSYSGLDEFKEPEFKAYGSEVSKQESNVVCDKKSDDSKENF